jgi:aspartyl protease family protein
MRLRSLAALLAFAPALCAAIDITVIGLFRDKAVITVDRGAPRTVSAGEQIAEGAKLVAVDSKGATVEIDGKRQLLEMGQHFATAAPAAGDRQSVTMPVMEGGHYVVDGTINGGYIRFLVDTGATLVSISSAEAQRLGINYLRGRRGGSTVADGRTITTYGVTFDSVTVGDITLLNVEGSVREAGGPALLGNSFLGRTEMRREGQSLTLTKRY